MKPFPRLLLVDQTNQPDTILWLESDGNYTRIHRQQQPTVLSARTLKRFEERLDSFIRIRHDVLVNPLHITRIHKNSPFVVKLWLSDGTMLVSSRRKKIETLALLQQMNRAASTELSS